MLYLLTELSEFDTGILAIMSVLLLMSSASWTLLLAHLLRLWRLRRYQSQAAELWREEGLIALGLSQAQHALARNLKRRHGPFYAIASEGLAAKQAYEHQSATKQLPLTEYLASQLTINAKSVRLSSGVTVLASIAATSPFLGLLGTVWGIHLALQTVSDSGQVVFSDLAPAISEALLITGLGIVVAVPALLMYNFLTRAYANWHLQLNYFAQRWHNFLLTGVGRG